MGEAEELKGEAGNVLKPISMDEPLGSWGRLRDRSRDAPRNNIVIPTVDAFFLLKISYYSGF